MTTFENVEIQVLTDEDEIFLYAPPSKKIEHTQYNSESAQSSLKTPRISKLRGVTNKSQKNLVNPQFIYQRQRLSKPVQTTIQLPTKKRHIYRAKLIDESTARSDFINNYDSVSVSNSGIFNCSSSTKNCSIVSSTYDYIGEGGFSKIYKFSEDPDNKAVKKIIYNPKIYSKTLSIEESVKREYYGMKQCECKNCVKAYSLFKNKRGSNYYILMERCDGNMRDLLKRLGRALNVYEIKELLLQLNEVFKKLKDNNIIHRDIKPINILFKEEKNDETAKNNCN